jgi:hypothetical protein
VPSRYPTASFTFAGKYLASQSRITVRNAGIAFPEHEVIVLGEQMQVGR